MPDVLVRVQDGVTHLTLNRPAARNALTDEMRQGLIAALHSAAEDDTRVVLIRGAGGSFCAGADRRDLGCGTDRITTTLADGGAVVTAITELPKPVVAAIDGPVAGAGLSLAAVCDLIVACESAVLHPAFPRVALAPDWGLSRWLVRSIGLHRAKDLLITGRPVTAAEARDLGLVARVWPDEDFESELESLVAELAAGATTAYGRTKDLLHQAATTSLEDTLAAETEAALALFGTDDHTEVVAALTERRPPRFTGR